MLYSCLLRLQDYDGRMGLPLSEMPSRPWINRKETPLEAPIQLKSLHFRGASKG